MLESDMLRCTTQTFHTIYFKAFPIQEHLTAHLTPTCHKASCEIYAACKTRHYIN